MKISLVIPAHNEEKYIAECLEHAIKNSHGIFHEIIVVDNASTDRTKEIAETFSGVRVVYEPSKGLTKARQKGLIEASGDFIAYIDADTHLPEGWTEKVVKAFGKSHDIVCVSGPYVYHDISSFKKYIIWFYWNFITTITYFFTRSVVVGGNFVAKRSTLFEIGGFDTTITFYGEDTNIARRLHEVGKVLFKNKLYMLTSARRLKEEGMLKAGFIYMINYLSERFFHIQATKKYKDIR